MLPVAPSRILRSAVASVLALACGLAMLGGSAYDLAVNLPDGDRENRAYLEAEPCASPPGGPADCLWEQEFTASDIVTERGRGARNELTLTAVDDPRFQTRTHAPRSILRRLEEGQKVTGTVWRGLPREITAGGDPGRTGHYPVDQRRNSLFLALVLAPGGLVVTAVCALRLVRRRAPTRPMAAALGLGLALPVAGLIMPMFLGDLQDRWWGVLLVWSVLAVLMTLTAWVYATYTPPEWVEESAPGTDLRD
ncbi:hypothetical protein [Nocardiopsis halophila]|uniref:hypothetical protein n=1 Tax=Nocardiopsis halophila TaxID=141692 RepID=UPI00034A0AEB|nr:hypothetical protein [Nocardiopsis halophila]